MVALGFVAALQLSIAAAQILLALTLAVLARPAGHRAARGRGAARSSGRCSPTRRLTLVATAFSLDPRASFVDSKQLVLFLHRAGGLRARARRARAGRSTTVIITVGAASAAYGIVQYGILHYDNLGQRPQGTLGHYMTYSGLLMLVHARRRAPAVRHARPRLAGLVMPALLVALALTFTRSAWVGACVGRRAAASAEGLPPDRRAAGRASPIVVAVAPPQVTQRFYSMFDLKDPTSRDRVAMLREGVRMIEARPADGVGPNMVERQYIRYRDTDAVERVNPHLHNVPMQIAAERGLPALAVWLWFVVGAAAGLWPLLRRGRAPVPGRGGLGAIAAMLAAGLFEYNFGDSEFLMLFLVLITLPFAAERDRSRRGARRLTS